MKTDSAALISPLIEDFHQLSYIIDHLKQESFGGPDAWLSEIKRATELRDKAVELIRREGDPELTGARVRVAVIGDFNAGKSSFINSLLGEVLCPVQARPTTSSITTFKYGDTEAIYLLKSAADDNDNGPARRLIERDEYERKVCHEGSKGQRYEFEVYYPFSGFRDIELYDTPGFGNAQNSDDERITLEKCEAADAIFFVFDINRGNLGADMRQRLDKIKQDNPRIRICAILNKSDQKSNPDVIEELCEIWREENRFSEVIAYSSKNEIQQFQEITSDLQSFVDRLKFTTTSWLVRHNQGNCFYRSAIIIPTPQRAEVMSQLHEIQQRKIIILKRNISKERKRFLKQCRNLFQDILKKINSHLQNHEPESIDSLINRLASKIAFNEEDIHTMIRYAVDFSIRARKLTAKEKPYFFSPYWRIEFDSSIFSKRINDSKAGKLISKSLKEFIEEIPAENFEFIKQQIEEFLKISENPSELFDSIVREIEKDFITPKDFDNNDSIPSLIDQFKSFAIAWSDNIIQERLLNPAIELINYIEKCQSFEIGAHLSKEQAYNEFIKKLNDFSEGIDFRLAIQKAKV